MKAAKLKENAFWVGCAVALLVLGVLYMTMYSPRADLLAKNISIIKQRNNVLRMLVDSGAIAGRPDIENHKKYQGELTSKLDELIKFYLEQDDSFEVWFSQLPQKPNETPNPGEFLGHWLTAKNSLDAELKGASADPAPGFRWELVGPASLEESGTRLALMKDMQKMFWVRQRIWDALKPIVAREEKDGKRVTELQEVAWLESIYSRFRNVKDLHPPGDYPGEGGMPGKYPGINSSKEFVVPGGLGRTLTFGITLKIKLSELPNFLGGLLEPNAKPKMLIELLGVKLEPSDVNEFNRQVDVSAESQDQDMKDHLKNLRPQPVTVRISARILDFDRAKLEEKQKIVTEARPKN